MRFNNLNFSSVNQEFTKKDVESAQLQVSQEKVDYAGSMAASVEMLGKNVNNGEAANGAFNFKFIPRDKIQFNPNNDFDMEGIDELATSLLTIGLQHNLGAFYDEDKNCYILESGERRLRACDMLFDKFGQAGTLEDMEKNERKNYQQYVEYIAPFFENGFPVNVKKAKYQDESDRELQKLDGIDSELRKYKANIDVRELTPQKRAAYIKKVRNLMEERNQILYRQNGQNAPALTQAEVAEAVGTSVRQLRKYDALDNLLPALKDEFEAGNISINKVPGIAALPEEEQLLFLELLQKGKNIDPAEIKLYQEHTAAAEKGRREAEEEAKRLEDELNCMRQSKEAEISAIMETAQQREEQIREEIKQAEKEKNEDLILSLRSQLEQEKKSSGQLIFEVNHALETTKRALADAKNKIKEMSTQAEADTRALRAKTELDAQLSLLAQASKHFFNAYHQYAKVASQPDLETVTNGILHQEALCALVAFAREKA